MNIYIVINGKRSFSEFSVKFCVGPLIAETELLAVVLSPSRSHNKVYTGGIWGEQKLHIRHVLQHLSPLNIGDLGYSVLSLRVGIRTSCGMPTKMKQLEPRGVYSRYYGATMSIVSKQQTCDKNLGLSNQILCF